MAALWQWLLTNWVAATTAVVAVWGAALSTFECHELAIELRERGMAGVVQIRAIARDSLGTQHRSKAVDFDITRWHRPPRDGEG